MRVGGCLIDRCYCRSLVVDFRLLIAPTSRVSKRSERNFENDHFLALNLFSLITFELVITITVITHAAHCVLSSILRYCMVAR